MMNLVGLPLAYFRLGLGLLNVLLCWVSGILKKNEGNKRKLRPDKISLRGASYMQWNGASYQFNTAWCPRILKHLLTLNFFCAFYRVSM
ncbi:hypothetical protein CsSME_00004154 [Camellia sinensis var. sinensis]